MFCSTGPAHGLDQENAALVPEIAAEEVEMEDEEDEMEEDERGVETGRGGGHVIGSVLEDSKSSKTTPPFPLLGSSLVLLTKNVM